MLQRAPKKLSDQSINLLNENKEQIDMSLERRKHSSIILSAARLAQKNCAVLAETKNSIPLKKAHTIKTKPIAKRKNSQMLQRLILSPQRRSAFEDVMELKATVKLVNMHRAFEPAYHVQTEPMINLNCSDCHELTEAPQQSLILKKQRQDLRFKPFIFFNQNTSTNVQQLNLFCSEKYIFTEDGIIVPITSAENLTLLNGIDIFSVDVEMEAPLAKRPKI